MRRICVLLAVLFASMLLPPAHATGNLTLVGVHPGKSNNFDPDQIDPMHAWQGKRNAILNVYTGLDAPVPTAVFTQIDKIWASGSVPLVTYYPLTPNNVAAAGGYDAQFANWGSYAKQWLAGPDLTFGNADDRRMYMRYAWEMNGYWQQFSPCHATANTTAADFVAAWRHVHDLWVNTLGIDGDHMQWIFSANSGDSCWNGRPEVMYPGDAYVDWIGTNVYDWLCTLSPGAIIDPMKARLQAIAPSKPFGIQEGGTGCVAPATKGQWLSDLFDWSQANDSRMQVLFNLDKEQPWAFFGYTNGDETYSACVNPPLCTTVTNFKAYSRYRQRAGESWVLGSDTSNPRLLTGTQFRGTW